MGTDLAGRGASGRCHMRGIFSGKQLRDQGDGEREVVVKRRWTRRRCLYKASN